MPTIRFLPASLLAVVAVLLWPGSGQAQQLKIFDAHLHYNIEASPFFTLDRILDVFRRNGIGAIVANSRPNRGTQQLVEAKVADLKVVPFIRPYRVPSDVQNWYNDPTVYELIETEYKRGYYRGVGEFHIQGQAAAGPWVKKVVDFAVERDLYLLAHSDDEAVLILLRHNPKAKVIWAHTGFTTPTARVREMLDAYPTLSAELSYRSGITEPDGKLSAEWRDLFAKHADRFVLGSDTWVNQRWSEYDSTMRGYRNWLAQLSPEQAIRIAHSNAERLFDVKLD